MSSTPSLTFSASRSPRRRWLRAVAWTLLVAVVLTVVAVLVAGSLWAYAWFRFGGLTFSSLDADPVEALAEGGATSPEGTTTVLVALTDVATDPGDAGAGELPPLAGPVALVQVGGPRERDAAVLLLPPQLTVTVDGRDPAALADVHRLGGPDVLTRTVIDYTGVAVDHVVIADAATVPSLVEVSSPVEVCAATCLSVDADGADARVAAYLAATPAQSTAALGELSAVVRALAERTGPVSAITSPIATKRTIDVLADTVVTDVDLRGAALLAVADQLASASEVAAVTVPGVLNPDEGRMVVLPEQAAARFAVLREGGVGASAAEDDEADVLAETTIAIRNGTGTAGFAAQLEARLAPTGVRIAGTENASNFDFEVSVVQFGPDDPLAEAAAILLARELGDVDLERLDRPPSFEGEPVGVVVIGGADLDDGGDTAGDPPADDG